MKFIIKASSLPTFDDSKEIYWKDLDGHWTREKYLARKMPKEVAQKLADYLKWEGVEVDLICCQEN